MNKMYVCMLFFALAVRAQTLTDSLKMCISHGLNFLERQQRKTTLEGKYYRGEWPVKMGMETGYFMLGIDKNIDDSNCFSVGAIHNFLARIYLLRSEHRKQILPMLDLAFEKMLDYKNGDRFNFWNLLPPNRLLKKGDIKGKQPLVRRPTNFVLELKYINNAANVTEDADDTSVAYLANFYRKKINEIEARADHLAIDIPSVAPIFDAYRDIRRKNRHWYNFINGNDHNTNAYLTWFGKEYSFWWWNVPLCLFHGVSFWVPFSACYPRPYTPYIPYGSNDLDGVVNANVLATLAVYQEIETSKGGASAIRFIEKKSKRKKYDRVGIYYPNRYHFPYVVCQAYATGAKGLEKSVQYTTDFVLERQNPDGSWCSRKLLNNRDSLQSTAYSVAALVYSGRLHEPQIRKAVESGIRFLLRNMQQNSDEIHWTGGVFFSGGTVVRNNLLWKSDSYSTAQIICTFANYLQQTEFQFSNFQEQ